MTDDYIEIPSYADETQLLRDIYTETEGPRKGIYLTFAQAQDLLRHHRLLPEDDNLTRLLYIKRGFNNRVYYATCTNGSEYVIRLGGRFWDHRKIINEKGALHLARKALKGVVSVPEFLATSAPQPLAAGTAKSNPGSWGEEKVVGRDAVIGGGKIETEKGGLNIPPYEYIIMDRLPGVPLDTVWADMALEDKRIVVDQVAEIFARLQSITLDKIGNFVESHEQRQQGNGEEVIVQEQQLFMVGPLMEAPDGNGGPHLSWGEFVVSNLRKEKERMLKEGDKFAVIREHLPRLESLIAKVESGELESRFEDNVQFTQYTPTFNASTMESQPQQQKIWEDRPIRFMHGDLEDRNILVVGTQLTGLHDFEFAGAYPVEQEWGQAFEWLFARAEDPFDELEQEKLRGMTDEQREIRDYFYTILQERHGLRPVGGPDGYLKYKVVLYHLQANIAPWWLLDTSPEGLNDKQTASLLNAERSLDKALTFLGC